MSLTLCRQLVEAITECDDTIELQVACFARETFMARANSSPKQFLESCWIITLGTVNCADVAINTAVMSSLASLLHAEWPLDGQIHSQEVRETVLGSNRGLLNDLLEGSRCSFNLLVVVDCVLPELEAARDIHARGDLAVITDAPGCNHTRFLVIVRWDAVAEVEDAGGHNQACDIAAYGLGTCALDAEH